jgi:hypothetical protein
MNRREALKSFTAPVIAMGRPNLIPSDESALNHRRLRILGVSAGVLEVLLSSFHQGWEYISIPEFVGLPEKVIINQIHMDLSNHRVLLMLWHPDFSPVPEGEKIPELEGQHFKRVVWHRLTEKYAKVAP